MAKKIVRRDASETTGLKVITANQPSGRSRQWDKAHNPSVASYRITTELKERIKNLAEELQVSPGALVVRLLDYALAAYDNGDLPITVEPVKNRLKQ